MSANPVSRSTGRNFDFVVTAKPTDRRKAPPDARLREAIQLWAM